MPLAYTEPDELSQKLQNVLARYAAFHASNEQLGRSSHSSLLHATDGRYTYTNLPRPGCLSLPRSPHDSRPGLSEEKHTLPVRRAQGQGVDTSAVFCSSGGGGSPGLYRAGEKSSSRSPKDAQEDASSLKPLEGLNLDPPQKKIAQASGTPRAKTSREIEPRANGGKRKG